MNYIRNACTRPELDVHEKMYYTGNILDKYVLRRAFKDVGIEVRNFVVPVRIFVYDEFVKLYEAEKNFLTSYTNKYITIMQAEILL